MIDAHCHLNATHTVETLQPVIDRFMKYGGTAIVDVTTDLKDITIVESFVTKFPSLIFAAIGLHPEYCTTPRDKDPLDEFHECLEAAQNLKNLIAIGETGLDYGSLPEDPHAQKTALAKQRELLIAHINAAKELALPLVIHARGKSFDDYSPYFDVLNIFKQEQFSGQAYFHSFGGDIACLKKLLDPGYMIGVNGIATYSNAKVIAESVAYAPINSLLLETDAPFLVPSNMDRSLLQTAKTNEPVSAWFTAKRIAALKGATHEEILHATEQNAKVFFAKIP